MDLVGQNDTIHQFSLYPHAPWWRRASPLPGVLPLVCPLSDLPAGRHFGERP
ncbi:unnamed protein product, partial [Nesidiocoris tenuis]